MRGLDSAPDHPEPRQGIAAFCPVRQQQPHGFGIWKIGPATRHIEPYDSNLVTQLGAMRGDHGDDLLGAACTKSTLYDKDLHALLRGIGQR